MTLDAAFAPPPPLNLVDNLILEPKIHIPEYQLNPTNISSSLLTSPTTKIQPRTRRLTITNEQPITMKLKLEICSDSDMARSFEILSLAFGHEHPYINAAYPSHSTPSGRAIGASQLLSIKHSDPCTTFLKVTDTDTGLMIASAKWNVYNQTIPPEWELDGDFWDTEEDKEYANLLSLDLLTVDPKYQRQGAGRLLVQWGTTLADKLGFTAVVESTEYGRGLYESEGFKFIDRWETRLPEKWEGTKGKQKFIWMVRPAKKIV
ncbi:hypothetical protein G7Y89_g13717 [Cudoniella acicularis]|uniref:N-acetyltransferase domain-containing protein n=1 Tax=Cudoniella acicularis TaxID=354080 RepID=A0A8H4R6D4_9HELO|nr:hypothetical protein G7Y89_g13717 [Cudoniella acicularis]